MTYFLLALVGVLFGLLLKVLFVDLREEMTTVKALKTQLAEARRELFHADCYIGMQNVQLEDLEDEVQELKDKLEEARVNLGMYE